MYVVRPSWPVHSIAVHAAKRSSRLETLRGHVHGMGGVGARRFAPMRPARQLGGGRRPAGVSSGVAEARPHSARARARVPVRHGGADRSQAAQPGGARRALPRGAGPRELGGVGGGGGGAREAAEGPGLSVRAAGAPEDRGGAVRAGRPDAAGGRGDPRCAPGDRGVAPAPGARAPPRGAARRKRSLHVGERPVLELEPREEALACGRGPLERGLVGQDLVARAQGHAHLG